jgi:alpha-glucosidase
VGEVGVDDSLATMAAYTAGGNKLHMAYSFNLLTNENTAAYVRQQVEELESRMQGGWPCWSIGNHDVQRVLTRWGGPEATTDYSKIALAMLLSLRGSACWYQGDELGLPEAQIPFELLQDPYGITFWPEFKGRDGCRTPMPWVSTQPSAGFSGDRNVKPWLPVPAEHVARAVDVNDADLNSPLHFTRRFLSWRKTLPALVRGSIRFFDAPEPVLALMREPEAGDSGPGVIAVFNLGAKPIEVELPNAPASTPIAGHGFDAAHVGRRDGVRLSLPGYGAYFGQVEQPAQR